MDYLDYLTNINNEYAGQQDPILQNMYSSPKKSAPQEEEKTWYQKLKDMFVSDATILSPTGNNTALPSNSNDTSLIVPFMQQTNVPAVPYRSDSNVKNKMALDKAKGDLDFKSRMANVPQLPAQGLVGMARQEQSATKKAGSDYLKDLANIHNLPIDKEGNVVLDPTKFKGKERPDLEKIYAPKTESGDVGGYKGALDAQIQSIKEVDELANEQLPKVIEIERKAFDDAQNSYKEIELNLTDSISKMNSMDEEIARLTSQEIDPNRFWKNKTTGQKVMMGIGLLFASMNNDAMKRALDGIDKAIENDIAIQKADIATKILGARERKGLINNRVEYYSKLFDNKLAGVLMAKNESLLALKRILDAKKETTSNLNTIANIEKAKTSIDLEIEQNKADAINAKREQLGQFAGIKYNVGTKAADSFGKVRDAMSEELKNKILEMKIISDLLEFQAKQKEFKKGKPISGDERKQYSFYKDAYKAANRMADALERGDWVNTIVGDNDYTINLRIFLDTLARPETGAVIGKHELEFYEKMTPSFWNLDATQKKKLKILIENMKERIDDIKKNSKGELFNDFYETYDKD